MTNQPAHDRYNSEAHPVPAMIDEPRAVRFSDLDLARRAAAEVSTREGYPQLKAMYLRGDNDSDADVQAALVAIMLVRRLESVGA